MKDRGREDHQHHDLFADMREQILDTPLPVRRRSAGRAVAVAMPLLASAGVAVGLVAAGSFTRHRAPNRPALRARLAPVIRTPGATGGVHARDTAYIVKRVEAKVAQDAKVRKVIYTRSYAGGHERSDGSLVNLKGRSRGAIYFYVAPSGTEYARSVSSRLTVDVVLHPVGNDRYDGVTTVIRPATHTYSVVAQKGLRSWSPLSANLANGRSGVRHAIKSGQVTQLGATTVNGRQAIALELTEPPPKHYDFYGVPHFVLYVDAKTYEPLRTAGFRTRNSREFDWQISDWVTARPGLVAKAEDASIPAGYIKVDRSAQ